MSNLTVVRNTISVTGYWRVRRTLHYTVTLLPIGSELFSSQTFSLVNTPTFSTPVILHTYWPMKKEQTDYSKTSAYQIQTPGNYPEESI